MNALNRAVRTRFGFGNVGSVDTKPVALDAAETKGLKMRVSSTVKTFFREFDRANNLFDPALLEPHLSDVFAGADPHGGVQVVHKNDFLATIGERQEYLEALGFRFVKIVPLEEIPLSEYYLLVKTHGVMRLEKPPDEPIDLVHDAAYVLYVKDGSPKIVFALSHDDPLMMAQEQGLFAAPSQVIVSEKASARTIKESYL